MFNKAKMSKRTIDQIIEIAKTNPYSLTMAEMDWLNRYKKGKKQRAEYRTDREYMRQHMAEKRAAAREISIPEPEDAERRESCRYDLAKFALTYFPFLFFLTLSKMHKEIFQEVQDAILSGGKIALAAPRGYGKTTILQVAIAWAILYGHSKYVVFICATGDLAKSRLRGFKRFFTKEDGLIAADFPEACAPVAALEGSPQRAGKLTLGGRLLEMIWGVDEIRFGDIPETDCSRSIVSAHGLDAAIRGLVEGELRPDLAIIDDAQTRESAKSPMQTKYRDEIIKADISGLEGAINPDCDRNQSLTIISLWTVIYKNDLADRYCSDLEPDYVSLRYKALPKLPDDLTSAEDYISRVRDAKLAGDRKARSAHAFYLRHREDIETGFEELWPERFDGRPVDEKYWGMAVRNEDFAWAERHANQRDFQAEEVSAIQSHLNKVAAVGWAAWKSEYQNDPEDELPGLQPPMTMEEICGRFSRVARGAVPIGYTTLTAGIDIGQSDIHWVVGAYGDGFSGSVIDFGVSRFEPGASEEAAISRELTKLLNILMRREFPVENDAENPLHIAGAAVDSGYQAKLIYQICRRCDWPDAVIPSRGLGGEKQLRPPKNTPRRDIGDHWYYARTMDGDARLFHIDVDFWKSFVDSRMRTPMGANGALTFFGRSGRELWDLAAHLRAERREKKTRTGDGQEYVKWRNDDSAPNHWHDCLVYSHALAHRIGVRLAEQEAPAPPKRKKRKTWFQ